MKAHRIDDHGIDLPAANRVDGHARANKFRCRARGTVQTRRADARHLEVLPGDLAPSAPRMMANAKKALPCEGVMPAREALLSGTFIFFFALISFESGSPRMMATASPSKTLPRGSCPPGPERDLHFLGEIAN
jgi:hypothetical protein